MTDILTKEKRSWNMSQIKGKDTRPETLLRSVIHRSGLRFRIHDNKLPGKPDIVLPRYKTVVFVNGCFWHRHKGCKYAYTPKSRVDFWESKFSRTVQRDAEKSRELMELGWHVFTAWECEINNDPEDLLERLLIFLKERN
mgnify:CR=1 FL=1